MVDKNKTVQIVLIALMAGTAYLIYNILSTQGLQLFTLPKFELSFSLMLSLSIAAFAWIYAARVMYGIGFNRSGIVIGGFVFAGLAFLAANQYWLHGIIIGGLAFIVYIVLNLLGIKGKVAGRLLKK